MSEHSLVAVVTGGGTGIGLATADALLRRGMSVLIAGDQLDVLENAAQQLRAGGDRRRVEFMHADVREPTSCDAIANRAVESLGRLDVLVTSAAVYETWDFLETDSERWDLIVDIALRGSALCAAAAARHMSRSGGGRIILISSVSAVSSDPASAAYDAAKGGVNSLTRSLAVDLAHHGIVANAVQPGTVRIRALEKDGPMDESGMAFVNPLGRVGEPEEVAAVIEFLACDAPAFLTGAIIPIDGGQTAMAPVLNR